MSTAKTAAERVSAMRRRRHEAGLRMLTLWVPKERGAEVRKLVRHALTMPPREMPEATPSPVAPALAEFAPASEALAGAAFPPCEQAGEAARWRVVLPPASTPAALKKALRQAGMVCAAAGRWHGTPTPAQRRALDPLVQEAQGRWEAG